MKKSLKKSLLVGLSVLMCGAFLAGCGNDSKNAENKDTLKVAVTNFARSLDPAENFFSWVISSAGRAAPS